MGGSEKNVRDKQENPEVWKGVRLKEGCENTAV